MLAVVDPKFGYRARMVLLEITNLPSLSNIRNPSEIISMASNIRDDMQEPWYFRSSVQTSVRIGGGYWLVGVLLEEFMNKNHRAMLEPLDICADFLRPSFEGPIKPPT